MAEATFGVENTLDYNGLNGQFGQISLGKGIKTASATAGAATLNQPSGVITSESLSTAAGGTYTLTLTNSKIAATDIVNVSLGLGTSTTGNPSITTVTPAAGSVVVVVQNIHASGALNGTLKFSFDIIKV